MIRKLSIIIAMSVLTLTLWNCKGSGSDPEPDPLTPLVGVWNCTNATRSGVAQDGYGDFKLTLAGTSGASTFTYACAGRPSLSPWPASGSWKFGTNAATDIVRDTDLAMNYSVTGTQLQVTFTYSGSGFARVNEVNGVWVFTFTK
jgi:hypothetical protein